VYFLSVLRHIEVEKIDVVYRPDFRLRASFKNYTPEAGVKSTRALMGTNFFAGDAAGGLGPYLAIYLLSAYHWTPGGIGLALAAGSITTVIIQTPAGALIDMTCKKQLLLAACSALIGI